VSNAKMLIPFQLHRRLPFVRRPFWQRDQAIAERNAAVAERDAVLAQRGGSMGFAALMADSTGMSDLAQRIFAEVRPYTMVPFEGIACAIRLAIETIDAGKPGDLVECGTWLGGSSFAMLLAQRYTYGQIVRPVWMFDSFEGLPPAGDRDGPGARQYQLDTDGPWYFDNCRAPIEQVREAVAKFGFRSNEAIIVPGWFHETIPTVKDEIRRKGIAVLRLDCDWYEPVKYVFEQLAEFVANGAPIIIDDYYAWDGCARATHEFLAKNDYSWRIRSIDHFNGAWMIKELG